MILSLPVSNKHLGSRFVQKLAQLQNEECGAATLAFVVLYNLLSRKQYDEDDFVIFAESLFCDQIEHHYRSILRNELYRFYDEHFEMYHHLLGDVKSNRIKQIYKDKNNNRKLIIEINPGEDRFL